MASRLTRWILITGIALGGVLVVLLPPGEAREAEYGAPPATPTNALDGAILANRDAISETEYRLTDVRRARALARFRADPSLLLVVDARRDGFAIDRSLTRAARALWKSLPAGSRPPRTLLILSGDRERILPLTVDRCEARLPNRLRAISQGTALYSGAGGCYLQAWFGPPGAGFRPWLDSIGGVEVPRFRSVDRQAIQAVVLSNDVWARIVLGYHESFAWWGSPELEACAAGRISFCTPALRFTPTEDARRTIWTYGWYRDLILADVPAALLRDLGPERFAALWHDDRAVPEAYQAITGQAFSEWAERYVQRRVGRVVRRTALTFEGWLGWVLWMGLLGAAMATRLRAQSVTA